MSASTQERSPADPAPTRQDLLWPHYARIVAICMVVLIHTVAGTVTGTTIGSDMWWGAVLLDSASSWAVPVFVMMSGALVLGSGRWTGAATFYRRRLVKIGIPTVAWIAIYLAYRAWGLDQEFGVRQALKLTLAGKPYVHLFFLFVILGLYAITPLLRIVTAALSRPQLVGLTAAWLSVAWFNDFIGNVLHVPVSYNALSYFISYGGYFLAGYVLRDIVVKGMRMWLLAVGMALCILGEAVEAYHFRSLGPLNKFSALTIAMSILAFVLLVQVGRIATERGYTGRVARVLSGAAFGVYLVHLIVLDVFSRVLDISLHPATVAALALTLLATIIVSWVVILIVERIPILRRIV